MREKKLGGPPYPPKKGARTPIGASGIIYRISSSSTASLHISNFASQSHSFHIGMEIEHLTLTRCVQ